MARQEALALVSSATSYGLAPLSATALLRYLLRFAPLPAPTLLRHLLRSSSAICYHPAVHCPVPTGGMVLPGPRRE